jgi:PHD/YefM family antitoxin component YafN of YafNO toxin-antitoxin module
MANIKPVSILRDKEILDEVSTSGEPLYVTKNGESYLIVMSPETYEEIVQERDHYKNALEREKELKSLMSKVDRSRKNIESSEIYSEADMDQMIDGIT